MEYFVIATEKDTPKSSAWVWLGILTLIGLVIIACR